MAVCRRGFLAFFDSQRKVLRSLADKGNVQFQITRSTGGVGYLGRQPKHNDVDYKYEVTSDPEEWRYVTRLLYPKTVPQFKEKDSYPSGWRPQTKEAFSHPYYIERTKNHMLPVYLKICNRGQAKRTTITRINGDLWKFHDELKEHLENITGKVIDTYVAEGNLKMHVRGDHVYYVQQFLLSKGF